MNLRAAVVGVVTLIQVAATLAATIEWLPPVPGTKRVRVFAITPDGRTAVGIADDGDVKAFRWTAEVGMEELPHLGAFWAQATDLSDDGRVILGGSSRTVRTGSDLRMEIVVWRDGVAQGTGAIVKNRNSPMTVTGDGRFILYGSNSVPDKIISLNGEEFGLPVDISPRLVSKDASTVFGFASGSLVRWNRYTGTRTMVATDMQVLNGVVAQAGYPAVFRDFGAYPQVWVEEFHGYTGFYEMVRMLGASGTSFISTDGRWLTFSDGFQRPVIEVWPQVVSGTTTRRQSQNVPMPLETWIGVTNVPPNFDITKFRPTSLSGVSNYHLAGWVPGLGLETYNRAFLIRNITPQLGITPSAQFSVTIQASSDMEEWTALTNITILAPVTLTNGFFRLIVTP